MKALVPLMAVLLCSPAAAQKDRDPSSEEMTAKAAGPAMDAVMSAVRSRIRTRRRVSPADFDRIFDDGFFKNSRRPFEDIRSFEQRLEEVFRGESAQIRGSYRRWASERLEEGPLRPSVEPGERTITVALRSPQLNKGSLTLDINRGRIKMSYRTPAKLQPPGRPPARSKRYDKIMPIPEGADPDRYRIDPRPDGLLIIFDRLKPGATEASE
ncbi:MAG: hypothetical protein RQ748_04470 [Elusimicrobiales bacterium]|nr:hypothetical protein [Elusimicrobiales bacterium]